MASNELAIRELNNLTKSKLIEIILNRKIPSDVKLSDSTLNLLEFIKVPNFIDNNSDLDVSKQNLTYKNLCIEKDLKCANYEIQCQKRVICEMERSISSQSKTIESQDYLLKILMEENNKIRKCDVAVPKNMSPKSKKIYEKSKEIEPRKKTSQNLNKEFTNAQNSNEVISLENMDAVGLNKATENISNDVSKESSLDDKKGLDSGSSENKWNLVDRRKRRGKMVVGVGNESQTETKVKGVPKTIDLHVYRIHPKTSAEDLKDMLKPHFGEVVTEALESRNPEIYSSFKVTIFRENFEKAMDATLWPKNTCVRRFLYIRKKNGQERI